MALGPVDLTKNAGTGGVQKITIPASPFKITGSDQQCRSCMVKMVSGTQVYLNIDADASANTWPLSEAAEPIPVQNTNQLNFFGTENDVAVIMWRN